MQGRVAGKLAKRMRDEGVVSRRADVALAPGEAPSKLLLGLPCKLLHRPAKGEISDPGKAGGECPELLRRCRQVLRRDLPQMPRPIVHVISFHTPKSTSRCPEWRARIQFADFAFPRS